MGDDSNQLNLGWWAISGEVLLTALRRAASGEDADLLYAELYANTENPPEPRSTSEVVMPRETLEERIHADGELWTQAFDQGVAMAPVLGAPGWVRWLLLRLAGRRG